MKPQDLSTAIDGARLANVMPEIEGQVERMKKTVQQRAFSLIREGKLTPEMAQNLWMETYASERLLKSLQTSVNIALDAGERVSHNLERS